MAASDAEIAGMRRTLRERNARRASRLEEKLVEARRDFQRIVRHIVDTYRPLRIWQWGSLIDGEHFWERSDIDIALEGITSAEAFFAILRDAEGMTSFAVDILQMETIHPAFAESIRARGRVVHER
jgi:predicted nucleotidyltransferase